MNNKYEIDFSMANHKLDKNININFNNNQNNNNQNNVIKSKKTKEISNVKRITVNKDTNFNKIIESKRTKFNDL